MPYSFRHARFAQICLLTAIFAAAPQSLRAETPVDPLANPLHVTVPLGQLLDRPLTVTTPAAAQEQIRRIPGGADFVPAEDFQDSYATGLDDMLAASPGVLAEPRWGEEVRLSIRGSGLSRPFHLRGIRLLQDGIPINFADGSGDFQEIDPLIIQHLEVYRGGQALRYGAGTLGGAVNIVTPTAATVESPVLLRGEVGSFNTIRAHAQAAHSVDHIDAFAAATRSRSDGFRDQSRQDNARFSGNIGVRINPQAETRFYAAWNDINQQVPGTLSRDDALNNPRSVPPISITNDYARDVQSLRLSNRTVFVLDNGMAVEGGAWVNDKSLFHPVFQVVDQDSIDVGAFGRVEFAHNLFDRYNEMSFGATLNRGVNQARRFVNIGGQPGALTADGRQTARNIELYGENALHFMPGWTLQLGAQGFIAQRDYTDHLNSGNNDRETYTAFNPKFGLLWQATPHTALFASLNRSAEPPTYLELVQAPNPGFVPLDTQTAWTAEIGTRGRLQTLAWDLTAYHARLRNELLSYTPDSTIPAATFNAGRTIHQGIEAGLAWQPHQRITIRPTYTLSHFHFDDDPQYSDNDLAGAPRHRLHLSVRYDDPRGFWFEPHLDWVPTGGYVDYANTLRGTSYTVIGAKAGADLTPNLSFFVDARNLLDERYTASFSTITDARIANTNVFYPGQGRSLFAGLKARF